MNLYIISNVLIEYSSGMVVIAAPTLERCRELFITKFGNDWQPTIDEYDEAIENGHCTVLSVVGQAEGIVSYVHGGG